MRNIKEKSALFFAKLEMKMKENNQEVLTISKAQRDYLENVAGPTQKFDAQICTLKNIVGCQESERETEFGLMKDVVKNLVYALEDKVSTELISNQAQAPNALSYLVLPDKRAIANRKTS